MVKVDILLSVLGIVLLFKAVDQVRGAKILFFYAGGTYSHKNGIWPLVSALADRGHNVTLLSPFSKQPTANPRVNDISPLFLQKAMQSVLKTDKLQERKDGVENWIWLKVPAMGAGFCKSIVENAKNDSSLRSVLYDNSYDLMIVNAIFSECGIMFAHLHRTRFVIAVSTSIFPWLYDVYGLPLESSWLPDLALQFNYPMGFYDRVKNYIWTLAAYYMRRRDSYPVIEQLMKETFELETVPDFVDLEREASLVLMNTFSGTEFGRSLPPFFVQIGGMQCWLPQKPLPNDFQTYMDGAEDGVIMIAFGSTIDFKDIPGSFHEIFFESMRKFPRIRFIWKWSGEEVQNKPENLFVAKWLPQMQILGHPKLLAFITHCGLNSVMEATYHGTPFIAVPLFGDQDYNAYHIKVHQMGVVVEARDLTADILTEAIHDVVTNPIYKENVLKISKIFRDRYLNPIEAGVFWTEFVLRNEDTSVLKPLNYHQPWWQRRLFDVSVFIFIFASFLLAAGLLLALCVCRVVNRLIITNIIEARGQSTDRDDTSVKKMN